MGRAGASQVKNEEHLCDLPLGTKVTVEQYSIEEVAEVLKTKGRQFFERTADDVITRGFISWKVSNY
jgi:hypothetical protein